MAKIKKKPAFDPREHYAELKRRVESGQGLTAREWDWFDARMREWEPEAYEVRRRQASVNNAIRYFREHLAPLGYRLVGPDGVEITFEEKAESA